MNHMEYFDCEMDIRQGNTGGRALLAFMPYNKNPKTPFSIVSLGLRQIAAYVALFPRYDKPSNLDYNTLYPLSTAFKVLQKRLANFHFFFHTELKDAESTQNGVKAQPILPLTLNSLSKLRGSKMAKNFSTEDVRLISKSSLGLMANLLLVHIGKLIQAQNIWKYFLLFPQKKLTPWKTQKTKYVCTYFSIFERQNLQLGNFHK